MKKNMYAYRRISDPDQIEGVSLEVQKEAIERFAESKGLKIIKWFEEVKSASKGIRPKFRRMLAEVAEGLADGCIFHKIDRISRNDADWILVNELADQGYDIYSATESINLRDHSTRLTADIQSVIAKNYSRNLSFEVKKGMYGRLRRGVYPWKAPVGYIDNGRGGNLKTIDKKKAPIIKKIFKLYTERGYSIRQIFEVVDAMDFRSARGKKVTRNGVNHILNNPFYAGLMRIKGEIYKGKHDPIITLATYQKAQEIMKGKTNGKKYKLDCSYRRLVTCHYCKRSLSPSKKKGHIYYRCHTQRCPTVTIREDRLTQYINNALRAITLPKLEVQALENMLQEQNKDWSKEKTDALNSLKMGIGDFDIRLDKLTDALIDGLIDKETYGKKRGKLLTEQHHLEQELKKISTEKDAVLKQMTFFFELLKRLNYSHDLGNPEEKNDLLKMLFSNLESDGKKLYFTMLSPYYDCLNRDILHSSALNRNSTRTKVVSQTANSSLIIPRKLRKTELRLLYKRVLKSVNYSNLLNSH